MLIYDPARKNTWLAGLLTWPARQSKGPVRWSFVSLTWWFHDDRHDFVICIYIYVYTGIYNQIPLFFCAHCLPKKNAIGGGIRNGMTCNKKTNSRWACLINSSSFWASAQPTLGRSVLAVLRPLRTSDESWWDLTQHIKNTATCVSSSLSLRNCQGHSRTWRCFVETPCMTS